MFVPRTDLLQVGDVIIANQKEWLYARGDSEPDSPTWVGGNDTKRYIVRDLKNKIVKSYDRYDKTRPDCWYVVIDTVMSGGGRAHNDSYSDELMIVCKRLTIDHKFDPNGEVCRFYQTGSFNHTIEYPEIAPLTMRQTFVKVSAKPRLIYNK